MAAAGATDADNESHDVLFTVSSNQLVNTTDGDNYALITASQNKTFSQTEVFTGNALTLNT